MKRIDEEHAATKMKSAVALPLAFSLLLWNLPPVPRAFAVAFQGESKIEASVLPSISVDALPSLPTKEATPSAAEDTPLSQDSPVTTDSTGEANQADSQTTDSTSDQSTLFTSDGADEVIQEESPTEPSPDPQEEVRVHITNPIFTDVAGSPVYRGPDFHESQLIDFFADVTGLPEDATVELVDQRPGGHGFLMTSTDGAQFRLREDVVHLLIDRAPPYVDYYNIVASLNGQVLAEETPVYFYHTYPGIMNMGHTITENENPGTVPAGTDSESPATSSDPPEISEPKEFVSTGTTDNTPADNPTLAPAETSKPVDFAPNESDSNKNQLGTDSNASRDATQTNNDAADNSSEHVGDNYQNSQEEYLTALNDVGPTIIIRTLDVNGLDMDFSGTPVKQVVLTLLNPLAAALAFGDFISWTSMGVQLGPLVMSEDQVLP